MSQPEANARKTRCDQNGVVGNVLVYVDDMLVTAEWRCSEEEMVMGDRWMRFCGYEFSSSQQGLLIGHMGLMLLIKKEGH